MAERHAQFAESTRDPAARLVRALAIRLRSRRLVTRLSWALLLSSLISAALLLLYGVVVSFWATISAASEVSAGQYKDFQQAYVLTRSIMAGDDPYQPVHVLVSRYAPSTPTMFTHPTPYPPTLALLSLPLAFLDFDSALRVWTLAQIVCLVGALYLIGKTTRIGPAGCVAPVAAVLVALWQPVKADLYLGNVNIFLLVLLAGLHAALLSKQRTLAGVLLGVSLLVKPLLWPLVLLFAVWRRFDALASAIGTLILGYSISMILIGPGRLWVYLTEVVPGIASLYGSSPLSFSLPSLGTRLFRGTGADPTLPALQRLLSSPPLVQVPNGEYAFAAATSLALVAGAAYIIRTRLFQNTGAALGLMVCVSIAISPIAWHHYLVLLLIPISYVGDSLLTHRFPPVNVLVAGFVGLLLAVPQMSWMEIAYRAAGNEPRPYAEGSVVLPFAPVHLPFTATLVTLAPLLAVVSLGMLIVRLSLIEGKKQGQT